MNTNSSTSSSSSSPLVIPTVTQEVKLQQEFKNFEFKKTSQVEEYPITKIDNLDEMPGFFGYIEKIGTITDEFDDHRIYNVSRILIIGNLIWLYICPRNYGDTDYLCIFEDKTMKCIKSIKIDQYFKFMNDKLKNCVWGMGNKEIICWDCVSLKELHRIDLTKHYNISQFTSNFTRCYLQLLNSDILIGRLDGIFLVLNNDGDIKHTNLINNHTELLFPHVESLATTSDKIVALLLSFVSDQNAQLVVYNMDYKYDYTIDLKQNKLETGSLISWQGMIYGIFSWIDPTDKCGNMHCTLIEVNFDNMTFIQLYNTIHNSSPFYNHLSDGFLFHANPAINPDVYDPDIIKISHYCMVSVDKGITIKKMCFDEKVLDNHIYNPIVGSEDVLFINQVTQIDDNRRHDKTVVHIYVKKNKKEEEEIKINLCVSCHIRPADVINIPCNHICICQDCHQSNNIKECPSCHSKIEDISSLIA